MAAKPIMIQGTMSSAGKSFLAAGLCRVFAQDGYRVAPFKSQNMALNSFITDEGLEMGRAQVVQAEACGIRPSVRMNPILLKPTTDIGSQVIVMGKPVGTMEARAYFRKKKAYVPVIREAYASLAAEHDVIVIEGAGSPAEINLKRDDIVNMGMAKIADAPVLLVGDIDRGGVFAQLLGTVLLLDPDERDRVAGLLINKFRGDPSILTPGLNMLEERVKKPVLGVIPYTDVRIEEEDSLAPELSESACHAPLDIAVIRFPRISNFTDFQMLEMEQAVSVRYVTRTAELGRPDLVILPGTKSTCADLLWMRTQGLEAAVLHLHDGGTPVLGICGGYQMLGTRIEDPDGVEGGGTVRGMGLLQEHTVFQNEKTMTQSAGRTHLPDIPALDNLPVSGYQVHMGTTSPDDPAGRGHSPFLYLRGPQSSREVPDGAAAQLVAGTYLHGLFDEPAFRGGFISWLAQRKGIDPGRLETESFQAFKERQYDLLADVIRKSVDLPAIRRIMHLSDV